jgi:hypothetical protein
MLQLLRAGVVAAGYQLVAIMIVTAAVVIFDQRVSADWTGGCSPRLPLLSYSYLIFAAGLALSELRSTVITAKRMRGMMPREELKAIAVQLGLPAILLSGVALQPPALGTDYSCLFSVGWAAFISICMVLCGATARAAVLACKR